MKNLEIIKQGLEKGTQRGIFSMEEVILLNNAYEAVKKDIIKNLTPQEIEDLSETKKEE